MQRFAILLGLLIAVAFCDTAGAYYHAQLGRFVSRDPIGYRGGMNQYGYVGGRPTGATDPSGTQQTSADAQKPDFDLSVTSDNLQWDDFPERRTPTDDHPDRQAATSSGVRSIKGGRIVTVCYRVPVDECWKAGKSRTVRCGRSTIELECTRCERCDSFQIGTEITGGFDRANSWVLRGAASDYLLEHERRHLRITETFLAKLEAFYASASGTAIGCSENQRSVKLESQRDLKTNLAKGRASLFAEMNYYQNLYDDHTASGENPDNQVIWNDIVDRYRESLEFPTNSLPNEGKPYNSKDPRLFNPPNSR